MNETGKHFTEAAEAASVQERKLADLEAALATTGNTTSSTNDNSNAAIVLAHVEELEKTLEDITLAGDRISSIDLQPKISATTKRVDALSREVNACLETAQQFKRELDFRMCELQLNMKRVEMELNVRVDDVESQVELSLQDMTTTCAQDIKHLAAQVWRELEEEHCQGLSRLNAVVSELSCRLSVQEDELSNVAKAVSCVDIIGQDEDQPRTCGPKPRLGRPYSFVALSSIAPQSSEGRSCTAESSPLEYSRTTGSPNFSTPSPIRNIGTPEGRIGELAWHEQYRAVEVSREGNTPNREKDVNVNACRGPARGGVRNEDEECEGNTLGKHARASSDNNERRMLVDLIEMFGSASQESGVSSTLDCSVFTITDTSRSADEIDASIDAGNMEVDAGLVRRTLYSTSFCKQFDEVPLHSEVATRPSSQRVL